MRGSVFLKVMKRMVKNNIFILVVTCIVVCWLAFLFVARNWHDREAFLTVIPSTAEMYINIDLNTYTRDTRNVEFVQSFIQSGFGLNELEEVQHILNLFTDVAAFAQFPNQEGKDDVLLIAQTERKQELKSLLDNFSDKIIYRFENDYVKISTDKKLLLDVSEEYSLYYKKDYLDTYTQQDIYFYISQFYLKRYGFAAESDLVGGVHDVRGQDYIRFSIEPIIKNDKISFTGNSIIDIPENSSVSFAVGRESFKDDLLQVIDLVGLKGVYDVVVDDVQEVSGYIVPKSDDGYDFVLEFDVQNTNLDLEKIKKTIIQNVATSFPRKYTRILPDGTEFQELFVDPGSIEVRDNENGFSLHVEDKGYQLFIVLEESRIIISNNNIEPSTAGLINIISLQEKCLGNALRKSQIYPFTYIQPEYLFEEQYNNFIVNVLWRFQQVIFIDKDNTTIGCFK